MKKINRITRRKLLKDSVLMGMTGALAPWTKMVPPVGLSIEESKRGLIAIENSKEGTTDWQLTFCSLQ